MRGILLAARVDGIERGWREGGNGTTHLKFRCEPKGSSRGQIFALSVLARLGIWRLAATRKRNDEREAESYNELDSPSKILVQT